MPILWLCACTRRWDARILGRGLNCGTPVSACSIVLLLSWLIIFSIWFPAGGSHSHFLLFSWWIQSRTPSFSYGLLMEDWLIHLLRSRQTRRIAQGRIRSAPHKPCFIILMATGTVFFHIPSQTSPKHPSPIFLQSWNSDRGRSHWSISEVLCKRGKMRDKWSRSQYNRVGRGT